MSDLFGTGIIFPIDVDVNGRIPIYSGSELVKSSIRCILGWPIHQRFFLPEFGSVVHNVLEEPNDAVLQQLVRHYITESINKFEKRVSQVTVEILQSSSSEKMEVLISYTLINTQLKDSFIYPFYKEIIY